MGRPGGLFISPNTVKAQLFSWWECNFQFSAKNQMQNNLWKRHFSVVYESKHRLFIYNYCGSFGVIFVVSPGGVFLLSGSCCCCRLLVKEQRINKDKVASWSHHFTFIFLVFLCLFFFFWWCLLLSLMFSCAPHPPRFPSHLPCSCLSGPALFPVFLPQLPPCSWGVSAPHLLLGLIFFVFLNPVFSSVFVKSSVLFPRSWCSVAFACSMCCCWSWIKLSPFLLHPAASCLWVHRNCSSVTGEQLEWVISRLW